VKRFQWRLQRVLDITEQREEALRTELLALAHRIVKVRQEIVARQTTMRMILAELAARALAERLPEQSVVLASATAEERVIRGLRAKQAELQKERAARTEQFLAFRARRRTLDRLREEARAKHLREEGKREQLEFDEGAHLAFARSPPRDGVQRRQGAAFLGARYEQ
jgi:flagellar export protein FliJ